MTIIVCKANGDIDILDAGVSSFEDIAEVVRFTNEESTLIEELPVVHAVNADGVLFVAQSVVGNKTNKIANILTGQESTGCCAIYQHDENGNLIDFNNDSLLALMKVCCDI